VKKSAAYRSTHGIDSHRSRPDGILRAVDAGGYVEMDTLVELLELLGTKTDYRYHVAVEILPTGSAILKTIDNERDARETIRRLKEKK
jgi:hypothetical protein